MTSKKKTAQEGEQPQISVLRIQKGRLTVALKGTTPLVMNRLSEKAKRELLFPSPKKTKGDKATTLKHDPRAEFRAAPYLSDDPDSPTLLLMPATSFKNALRGTAVDIPGASSKAALGRLTYVENEYVGIYGIPKLYMAVVRMADINRTPDIRTRVIVPQWAARITISYAIPLLTADAIIALMSGAGILQGVGDGRVERGKLSFGGWELCDDGDAEFQAILKNGRDAQEKAMADALPYDKESTELLSWFEGEADRRGFKAVS